MIAGVPIVLIGGIINLLLVIFQLLSGTRVIKVSNKIHRLTGFILLVCASLHGLLAILINI